MSTNKPRVIKDFEKLDSAIQEQIKLVYPEGFSDYLVYYTNKDGFRVTALPFETDEKYYLVRMTIVQAKATPFFYNSQALPSSVQVGIQNTTHRRLDVFLPI